jgi:two-component system, response regulator
VNREVESRKMLLVEDNLDDIELILRALRKGGIGSQVDVVQDGEEALDYLFGRGDHAHLATATPPSVVLLDLKLLQVGGMEVLKEMRGNERTRQIPVVVLTSSTQEDDLAQAYQLGANSYLHKPVDYDSFRELVRQLGLYWLVDNEPPQG